jgi:hypothetical protein
LAATGFHIFFLFLLYTSLSKKSQTLVMNVDTHVSRFVDRIELFFFRRRGYVVRSLPRGEIVCKLCCYLPRTVYNSELVYSFIWYLNNFWCIFHKKNILWQEVIYH